MTTATITRPTAAKADSRMAKAVELLAQAHTWNHGTIKRTGQRIHLVPGSQGKVYWTTATACTCPDFQGRGLVCKHAMAVAMHEAQEAAAEAARLLDDDSATFVQWLDAVDRAGQLQRDIDDVFGAEGVAA